MLRDVLREHLSHS